MRKFPRPIHALALVFAAFAATWWLWASEAPALPAAAATETAGNDDPLPAAANIAAATANRAPRLPLPPLEASVPDLLAELQPRAQGGDNLAACRLAVELLDCVRIARQAEALRQASRRDRDETPVELPAEIAAERAALFARDEQCRAAGDADQAQDQAARWLEQAARAGEPEAVLRYAAGEHFEPMRDGLFVDPAFDRWRRDALPMLERAFAGGDVGAIDLLHRAYSDDFSLFTGLVADDPERARAYLVLQFRLAGETAPPVPLADTAAEERADRLAAGWQVGAFAATPVPTDAVLGWPGSRLHLAGTPAPCEAGPR